MKCFYHSSDLDGICSAAIVKHKYPEVELIGINYGQSFPWSIVEENEKVFMVDFCLSYEDMSLLCNKVELVWIDHHESAINKMTRLMNDYDFRLNGNYRIGIGACQLVWEYLFPSESVPIAVKLLAEYDVWNHSNPMTLPFQYGMRSMNLSPDAPVWDNIFNPESGFINSIMNDGEIVLAWEKKENAIRSRVLCFETELEVLYDDSGLVKRYKILAANQPMSNSKFFDDVDTEGYDFVCLFSWKPSTSKWTVSLYSLDNKIKVNEIAEQFGGGGHPSAAGFEVHLLPFHLGGV